MTGSYDPEFDLVYWGIGNPAPWNPRARSGDNLYTNSVFAVRPKTGERVWYYQTTPEDPFDYDAVQTPVLATLNVGGTPTKVVMQANRSGFLYVLDAKDGKLIAANPFGKVNWADGIDKETGRPKVTSVFKEALEGKKVTVWPSVSGVTNWQHMSFSPKTGMLYINTLHVGMTYEAGDPPKLVPGRPSGSGTVKRTTVLDDPDVRGYLKAVDPLTGKSKWETPYKSPNYSSTMVTASDLVFTGVMTGEFQALDAETGKILWSFQTPSGIVGQPITWEKDGKQYVTVMSGIGGVYALRSGDPNLVNVPGRCDHVDVRPVRQVAEANRGSLPPASRGSRVCFHPQSIGSRAKTPTQTGRRFRTMGSTHDTTCHSRKFLLERFQRAEVRRRGLARRPAIRRGRRAGLRVPHRQGADRYRPGQGCAPRRRIPRAGEGRVRFDRGHRIVGIRRDAREGRRLPVLRGRISHQARLPAAALRAEPSRGFGMRKRSVFSRSGHRRGQGCERLSLR